MLDQLGPAPDLDLLLSPGDEAEFVALGAWVTRAGRAEPSRLYLVLHRRHGLWTHAYRIVPDRRPGHLAIYLERALPGDRREELRAWLLDRPGIELSLPHCGVPGRSGGAGSRAAADSVMG